MDSRRRYDAAQQIDYEMTGAIARKTPVVRMIHRPPSQPPPVIVRRIAALGTPVGALRTAILRRITRRGVDRGGRWSDHGVNEFQPVGGTNIHQISAANPDAVIGAGGYGFSQGSGKANLTSTVPSSAPGVRPVGPDGPPTHRSPAR